MAREVVWTELAWEDRAAAADYIARDSEYYAVTFVQEVREAAASLAPPWTLCVENARAYSRILGGNTGTTLTPLLVLKLEDETGSGDNRQERIFRERNPASDRIHP